MQPQSSPDVQPPPLAIGEVSRLTGVFFEPAKAFADIARRPTFIVPLLLIIAIAIGYSAVMSERIGFERIAQQQMESSSRWESMTPQQRADGVALGAKMGKIFSYVFPIVGLPLFYLIAAGVLLGMCAMMSAGITFKQVYAIMTYASLPGILFMGLGIVMMFIKKPEEFDVQNPLAFNIGAFLEPNQPSKFVYSIATGIDLFTIWTIVLVAIGLKAAAGRRLSFGSALIAVLVPWGAWRLIAALLAGMR